LSRRKFTREFKEAAIRKLMQGTPAAKLARTCRVNPATLRRWQKELDEFGERAFGGYGKSRQGRAVPRSQVIVIRMSPDELDTVKKTSSAAGCRSLAEFARSCMLDATGEPPLAQAGKILEELSAAVKKLTQTLAKE